MTIGTTSARRFDLAHRHLGQPDVAHLALVAQLGQHAELVLGGNLGVDAVQLEEVDLLQAEPAEAHLALLAQVLGPPYRVPAATGRYG